MILSHFFHVFIVNNQGKWLWSGALARFYRPGGLEFSTFFLPGGWGICQSKKMPGGRRWSGLELTNILVSNK